jgi:hypothetical protein
MKFNLKYFFIPLAILLVVVILFNMFYSSSDNMAYNAAGKFNRYNEGFEEERPEGFEEEEQEGFQEERAEGFEEEEPEGFQEDELEGFQNEEELDGFQNEEEPEGFEYNREGFEQEEEQEGFQEDELEGFEKDELRKNTSGKSSVSEPNFGSLWKNISTSVMGNVRVEPMAVMSPSLYGVSPVLDRFSQFSDSPDSNKNKPCYSGGLHNSRGPLCLTDDLITIVKTRGGNASGR